MARPKKQPTPVQEDDSVIIPDDVLIEIGAATVALVIGMLAEADDAGLLKSKKESGVEDYGDKPMPQKGKNIRVRG